jgi:hypothetical protein
MTHRNTLLHDHAPWRYTPTTVLMTPRFRRMALTALFFVVIATLVFLLLAPQVNHANGHLIPWLCLAPFLLFAVADFRRTLPVTGSTMESRLSPLRALLSRLQLPPPSRTV